MNTLLISVSFVLFSLLNNLGASEIAGTPLKDSYDQKKEQESVIVPKEKKETQSVVIKKEVPDPNKVDPPEVEYEQCISSYDQFRANFRETGCEELVRERVKNLSLFFGFGARTFGFKVNRKNPEENEEILAAEMVGDYNPAVFYSASLGTNYLFDSNLAYDFSFGLYNFTVTKQRLVRDSGTLDVDLGNYITGNIVFFTPRIFYSFGANDDTPDQYFNIGLGAGAGYSYFKGNIFLTEGVENTNPSCHSFGEELIQRAEAENAEEDTSSLRTTKEIEQDIIDSCEKAQFEEQGRGFSFGVFLSGRWDWFFMSLEFNQVEQSTEEYIFQPTTVAFTFAYVVDL